MGSTICKDVPPEDNHINTEYRHVDKCEQIKKEQEYVPFVIERSKPIFISRSYTNKNSYRGICKECNDIFYDKDFTKEFCSIRCRDKNKKICKNCGKIYYSSLKNICSINCKKNNIIIKRSCDRCGRTFMTNDKLNKFCGAKNCYYGTNCIDKVIKWLNYIASRDNVNIQHVRNNGEYRTIIDGKVYLFNGYDKKNNTVYEFYTNLGHGNPRICDFKKIDIRTGKTYEQIYNETIAREDIIRKHYNVISIWEDEFDKLNLT